MLLHVTLLPVNLTNSQHCDICVFNTSTNSQHHDTLSLSLAATVNITHTHTSLAQVLLT